MGYVFDIPEILCILQTNRYISVYSKANKALTGWYKLDNKENSTPEKGIDMIHVKGARFHIYTCRNECNAIRKTSPTEVCTNTETLAGMQPHETGRLHLFIVDCAAAHATI